MIHMIHPQEKIYEIRNRSMKQNRTLEKKVSPLKTYNAGAVSATATTLWAKPSPPNSLQEGEGQAALELIAGPHSCGQGTNIVLYFLSPRRPVHFSYKSWQALKNRGCETQNTVTPVVLVRCVFLGPYRLRYHVPRFSTKFWVRLRKWRLVLCCQIYLRICWRRA